LERAQEAFAEAWRPWAEGYYDLKDRLEAEGFAIRPDPDMFPSMAPIQLEGRLPSGEQFYFRGRGRQCSLSIAPSEGDPVGAPTWMRDVSRWEWPKAGSLPAEEAEAVLRELLALYEQGKRR